MPTIIRYKYAEMKKRPVHNTGITTGLFFLIFLTSQPKDAKKKGIVPKYMAEKIAGLTLYFSPKLYVHSFMSCQHSIYHYINQNYTLPP